MEESEKEQAIKQFRANAEKLEEFIKENMPEAEYELFLCDMKLGISNMQFYQHMPKGREGLLNPVFAAFFSRITEKAKREDCNHAAAAYSALLQTLFFLAEINPIMKDILQLRILEAAPKLDFIEAYTSSTPPNHLIINH